MVIRWGIGLEMTIFDKQCYINGHSVITPLTFSKNVTLMAINLFTWYQNSYYNHFSPKLLQWPSILSLSTNHFSPKYNFLFFKKQSWRSYIKIAPPIKKVVIQKKIFNLLNPSLRWIMEIHFFSHKFINFYI